MDKLDPHYQDIAAVRSKPLSIFVKKLWIIVNDPGSDQLIRWDDSGRSIWILDANQFSKTVVPCYFKHSNWHSFVRQLNLYGFRKVCDLYPGDGDGSGGGDIDHRLNDTWQFRNSFFRRNQPHLLHFVKRNRKGRLPRQSTPHHGLIASATGSSIIPRIPSVGGPDHQQEQPDVDVALRRLEMIEHDLQGVEMQGISVQQNITAMRNLQYRQSQVLINLLGLTKLLAQTSHFHDSRALQVDVTQLNLMAHECQVHRTQLDQRTSQGSAKNAVSINTRLYDNLTSSSNQTDRHLFRSTLPFANSTIHQDFIRLPPLFPSCPSF